MEICPRFWRPIRCEHLLPHELVHLVAGEPGDVRGGAAGTLLEDDAGDERVVFRAERLNADPRIGLKALGNRGELRLRERSVERERPLLKLFYQIPGLDKRIGKLQPSGPR